MVERKGDTEDEADIGFVEVEVRSGNESKPPFVGLVFEELTKGERFREEVSISTIGASM